MRTIISAQAITLLFAALVPEVTVTEVSITVEGILVTAFVPMPSAPCPHCGTVSTSIHSYYTRQPHDVSLSGQPVRLLLQLRRFRCLNTICVAATFSERLPTLLAPAAQRTARLNASLRDLALAFGGQAGARQSARIAMAASGDTLLRRAQSATLPARATPRVLGVDDFAFQKGQVYGTILTDGETHASSTYCPTGARRLPLPGFVHTLGLKLSRGTGPGNTPVGYAPGHQRPCRLPTASTSSRIQAKSLSGLFNGITKG